MREPRQFGEALVISEVNKLIDEFRYPDEIGGGGVVLGGGGGAPTVVVAASDATDLSKSKADFVAIGVNDEDVILAARDLIKASSSNNPGRILLTEGSFDAVGFFLGSFITLQAMGRHMTTVHLSGAIETGAGATIRDLTLDGDAQAGELLRLWASDQSVYGVHFFDAGTAIDGAQDSLITHCTAQLVTTFYDSSSGWTGTTLVNNGTNTVGAGIPDIILGPACDNHLIAANSLGGRIYTATATHRRGIQIVGNLWPDNLAGGDALIDINGAPGIVIIDNHIWDANGLNAIDLVDADGAVIAGNLIDSCDRAIYVSTSDDVMVSGNSLGVNRELAEDGIVLNDANWCLVEGNLLRQIGGNNPNTYDAIRLEGNCIRNLITKNTIKPTSNTRYGVNIATTEECNIVVGNALGDPDDYGTDALNDNGANTQLFYPNDATYGDNFTDCGTGS